MTKAELVYEWYIAQAISDYYKHLRSIYFTGGDTYGWDIVSWYHLFKAEATLNDVGF
jgi:hypothetical protein